MLTKYNDHMHSVLKKHWIRKALTLIEWPIPMHVSYLPTSRLKCRIICLACFFIHIVSTVIQTAVIGRLTTKWVSASQILIGWKVKNSARHREIDIWLKCRLLPKRSIVWFNLSFNCKLSYHYIIYLEKYETFAHKLWTSSPVPLHSVHPPIHPPIWWGRTKASWNGVGKNG